MRLPRSGKSRTLDAGTASAPGGGEGAENEWTLRAELAALNALFEAAAMGEEGEAFARSVSELPGKRRFSRRRDSTPG